MADDRINGSASAANGTLIREAPAGIHRRSQRAEPGQPTVARLLIFHGYGDHSGRFAHFQKWLADRGVATDSFDFRGHGRSSGRRGYVRRWDEYLDDVHAALDACQPIWTNEGLSGVPLFVLGHSHGGLVLAAATIAGILAAPAVAGCIMTAPYLAPAEPLTWPWRLFAAASNVLSPSLRVKSGLSADMMTSDPVMLADSHADPLLLRAATPRWYTTTMRKQAEVLAAADGFTLPLLCLFGDQDRIASSAAARAFVESVRATDKSFEVIAGARHEILRETTREQTFSRILAWMRARTVATINHNPPEPV
jgi:alpha-beta hydrolase superfamily lysophospholipase